MAIVDGMYINSHLVFVLCFITWLYVIEMFAKVKLLSTLDGDVELYKAIGEKTVLKDLSVSTLCISSLIVKFTAKPNVCALQC